MAKSNIELKGFDELIAKIERASGNANAAALKAANAGAIAYESTLKAECAASGVPGDLTAEIRREVKSDRQDRVSVRAGWAVPTYNKTNPAPAFKVIFLNYGTQCRFTRRGGQVVRFKDGSWRRVSNDRGALPRKDFIARAKKRAKSQIKNAQEQALKEMLKELGG